MASKYDKMRDTLLLSIEQVRSGAMSTEKASAISKLASQVSSSLDAELRVLISARVSPAVAGLVANVDIGPRQIGSGTVENPTPGVTRHSIGE